jgi:hypothetical protein
MMPDEAIEYAPSEAPPQTARSKVNKPYLSERELEILRLVAEGLTDSRVHRGSTRAPVLSGSTCAPSTGSSEYLPGLPPRKL